MLITEYRLNLPDSFDVDDLRDRIPGIGAARFDDRPGLGLKAFLLRQRMPDQPDAPSSQYAPFYVWTDAAAAGEFFLRGAFSGVARTYGRPVVRTWLGGGIQLGGSPAERITHAVRTSSSLPPLPDPAPFSGAVRDRLASRAAESGLHSIAWGVDPADWTAVTMAFHTRAPEAVEGSEAYEVPHVSAPEWKALLESAGRQ